MFLLIFRERGSEVGGERNINQLLPIHHTNQGSNLQPRYVLRLGTKPAIFHAQNDALTT